MLLTREARRDGLFSSDRGTGLILPSRIFSRYRICSAVGMLFFFASAQVTFGIDLELLRTIERENRLNYAAMRSYEFTVKSTHTYSPQYLMGIAAMSQPGSLANAFGGLLPKSPTTFEIEHHFGADGYKFYHRGQAYDPLRKRYGDFERTYDGISRMFRPDRVPGTVYVGRDRRRNAGDTMYQYPNPLYSLSGMPADEIASASIEFEEDGEGLTFAGYPVLDLAESRIDGVDVRALTIVRGSGNLSGDHIKRVIYFDPSRRHTIVGSDLIKGDRLVQERRAIEIVTFEHEGNEFFLSTESEVREIDEDGSTKFLGTDHIEFSTLRINHEIPEKLFTISAAGPDLYQVDFGISLSDLQTRLSKVEDFPLDGDWMGASETGDAIDGKSISPTAEPALVGEQKLFPRGEVKGHIPTAFYSLAAGVILLGGYAILSVRKRRRSH